MGQAPDHWDRALSTPADAAKVTAGSVGNGMEEAQGKAHPLVRVPWTAQLAARL